MKGAPFYFILNPLSSVCRSWIPRAVWDICTKKIPPTLPISIWLWVHKGFCWGFTGVNGETYSHFNSRLVGSQCPHIWDSFIGFLFIFLIELCQKSFSFFSIWRLKIMHKAVLPRQILLLSLENVWICGLGESGKSWFLFLVLSLPSLSNHLHLHSSSSTSCCLVAFQIGGAIWNGRHTMKDVACTCGKE